MSRTPPAPDKVTRLVYEELRRLAHHYMQQQRPDHTLQTTALVHEAYLKLAGHADPNYANRSHFLAVAAKAMRQILVDHAKATLRGKRGAGAKAVELDESALLSPEPTREVVELDEALENTHCEASDRGGHQTLLIRSGFSASRRPLHRRQSSR